MTNKNKRLAEKAEQAIKMAEDISKVILAVLIVMGWCAVIKNALKVLNKIENVKASISTKGRIIAQTVDVSHIVNLDDAFSSKKVFSLLFFSASDFFGKSSDSRFFIPSILFLL
jgi:dienelactone hydrolase